MQQKIVYAGTASSSYAKGAELLEVLGDIPVPVKQVERLSRDIGVERVGQRDAAVAAFDALPLVQKFEAPSGVQPPDLAVVMSDGGRLQIRERLAFEAGSLPAEATSPAAGEAEEWDEEPPAAKGFWREDKISLLVEMESPAAGGDPCPEIPPGFLDVLRIPKLAREIGKVAAKEEDDDAESAAEQVLSEEAVYEPPKVERRRVAATCQPWCVFARMVARAAWAAGFQKAKRKAFVGDGSANNWRLQRRFFGSFVPILDFIHTLSYVFAAAMAGRPFAEGWGCYQRWIGWVWKGEVKKVIEELSQRQQDVGLPGPQDGETSVKEVVKRTLGYLSNHQDKMKYAEYRKLGLPITSSLMESLVKQMNYRVKGSEKFWCQEGAEGIVQLRADYLSDDKPLEEFWRQRQATTTGQRRYRRAA